MRSTTLLGVALTTLLLAPIVGCGSDDGDGGSGGSGGSSTGGKGGSGGRGGSSGSGGSTAGSGGSGGSSGGSGGSSGGSGGSTGGSGGSTGGSGGSGGSTGSTGSTGGSGGDAAAGSGGSGTGGSGGSMTDAKPADTSAAPNSPMPGDYGGVGQQPLIPLQHTATPTPPLITPECPDDPTQGFTEYQDSFVIQRPRNLAASERFKYENGIYSFEIRSGDQAHKPNNTTAPRTEARYSDIGTGEHIFSADMMFESPSRTCVFQIHNVNSPIAIYLRVVGDRMFNLSSGQTILTGQTGKWFNLKVAFNIQTRQVRTYINNCLKATSSAPNTASVNLWYFKHGVYTCDSGTCRSHYKNVRLYQKGSTDKFHTKSTYP
jgi:hypothetical protein